MALNAHITGIRTRSTLLLWLLRQIVRLCGAQIRMWRNRPRREKSE